jgi:hypothetical protein
MFPSVGQRFLFERRYVSAIQLRLVNQIIASAHYFWRQHVVLQYQAPGRRRHWGEQGARG